MPIIPMETEIKANRELVFDLSRSIDLHMISTENTNETAIAGKTGGLINLNESVTWRAKHFGIYQKLTSKITRFERPNSFRDEMVSGAFKSFKHDHCFSDLNGGTLMTDIFNYQVPFGFVGRMFNKLLLKEYLTTLIKKRNQTIKIFAESGKWKKVPGLKSEYEV